MLLKVTTAAAVLLVALVQYVEGFERVIVVNESVVHDDGQVISHYDEVQITCCIYGNCSCSSLYNSLANLTSNVLINITTDVELSSIISLIDLTNITITGHNNPTVNCNSSGGLHFVSCHNCLVEGITWKECGTKDVNDNGNLDPVILLYSCSNITIENCSFRDSAGQVIVLSEILGNVSINFCNFLSSKHYNGHGTAIFYSSPKILNNSLLNINFNITNCVFSHNEGTNSVIYSGQSMPGLASMYLQNSKFHNNIGVPIYLRNKELHINGENDFFHNKAENGGGIVISDHSNVILDKNATVSFKNNIANSNGGAIFLTNHSTILFKQHLTCCKGQNNQMEHIIVVFHNNSAKYGGAIYTENSRVIFGECAIAEITSNKAERHGGAIKSVLSIITYEGSSMVTFNDNYAQEYGGVIIIDGQSTVTFEGNSILQYHLIITLLGCLAVP